MLSLLSRLMTGVAMILCTNMRTRSDVSDGMSCATSPSVNRWQISVSSSTGWSGDTQTCVGQVFTTFFLLMWRGKVQNNLFHIAYRSSTEGFSYSNMKMIHSMFIKFLEFANHFLTSWRPLNLVKQIPWFFPDSFSKTGCSKTFLLRSIFYEEYLSAT